MRILQIFPGKVWGGAEQYVLDLGRALRARGHDVIFMCVDSAAVTSRLDGDADYLIYDKGSRLQGAVAQADVVHIHDARFLSPVHRAVERSGSQAKVVLTRHIARPSRTMWWRRGQYRKLHRMIFVSELAYNLWSGVNKWMTADKMAVVHNSIADHAADHTASATSLRERLGVDDGTPIIMFTGRIRRSKGCSVLVEALGQLRNLPWHMVFVGTCKPADYRDKLLKKAERHGITGKITFTGFSSDVYSLVRQCDIGVAPSIVREACPLSPMEFMKMGKCVIATDNGAQPEYVQGLLVPPADEQDLADALYKAITDSKLRDELGAKAARYFSEHMSYREFVTKILACYC